jgi:RalA-binding protein 1
MLTNLSDLDERSKKIQAFNILVHKLPQVNFELLRHMSSFLIEIVENSGINKMTVRNVGIVFAPTLNIPAPLISFFLTDYQDIFGMTIEDTSLLDQDIRTTGQFDDETRSPRQQTFYDVPAPAYNDSSFQPQVPLNQQQWNGRPPSAFPMNNTPAYPPPQPPQQQQQQYAPPAGYDTGFVSARPSHGSHNYEQQYHGAEGYGNLNSARQPVSAREQKQKRRESSMLLMNVGMGQRKGSNGSNPPRPRDDFRSNPMLIREETAFD